MATESRPPRLSSLRLRLGPCGGHCVRCGSQRSAPGGPEERRLRGGTVLLWTLVLVAGCLGRRPGRPPRPPGPLSAIQPKADFNAEQFAGTWILVALASACRPLQEQGSRAEATALHVVPQGQAMAINTLRKLDGICWEVQQLYGNTAVPGRFLLQGTRQEVQVAVGDTDYQSFAILYLERAQRLSVKLYVRSLPVNDLVVDMFEQRIQAANLTEDHILYFPKYGFCDTADQFHILDEVGKGGPRQPSLHERM